MTYSSTAAVHAIILVLLRKKLVAKHYLTEDMVVLVNGTSETDFNDGSGDSTLWLPVIPMAWDDDSDPVLAIVGTTFLVFLPMQLWSKTFKKSEAKTLLLLWSVLLFIGTLSALINSAYLDLLSFPQLRFCPPDANDTFPVTNGGMATLDVSSEMQYTYYWNKTVYDTFPNSSRRFTNACIYPCFTSSWPLRDATEITVVISSYGRQTDDNTEWSLLFVVYALVVSSCLSSLTILAIDVAARHPAPSNATITNIRTWVGNTIIKIQSCWLSRVVTSIESTRRLYNLASTTSQQVSPSQKYFAPLLAMLKRLEKYIPHSKHFYLELIDWSQRQHKVLIQMNQ